MISILCPTRGRPDNIQRLVDSVLDTVEIDVPDIILYIDEDDVASNNKAKELQLRHIVGKRILLSNMWNVLARLSSADIMMHAGDDILFRTKGWDKMVVNAFKEDPFLFVHGEDGYFGKRFGTHGFIHRRWYQAVGYFVPPYFSCDYNDTWLNDVANILGKRRYLPFVTEHMHPNFGKAPIDQTHQDRMLRGVQDNVGELYAQLAPKREEDVQKLRGAIADYELPGNTQIQIERQSAS